MQALLCGPMMSARRRCAECGRFLGRYLIAAPDGLRVRLVCPPCGPRVDGGQIQRDGNAQLRAAARACAHITDGL